MGPLSRIRRAAIACSAFSLFCAGPALAETQLYPASAYLVDLSEGHWCYDCTTQVVDRYAILGGYQDHTFRGDWAVDRYTLATAVARTLSLIQLSEGLPTIEAKTARERTAGVLPEHWAYPYVRKLSSEQGLLSLMLEQGQLHGQKTVTRKELAYALSEFLGYIEKLRGQPLNTERRTSQLAVDLEARSAYTRHIELALNRYQFMNLYADHTFRPEQPVTRYALSAALCKVFELFDQEKLAQK